MLLLGNACDDAHVSEQPPMGAALWKPEDLEINKRQGGTTQFRHKLYVKPTYYTGEMPLIYKSIRSSQGLAAVGGLGVTYAHEFDEFTNYFIYDHHLLKGIVAVDKANTMAAEAKLEWQNDAVSGFYRPTMEEFHYATGKLLFRCRSKIDYEAGMKSAEAGQVGTKRVEYFFILPLGMNE